MNDAIVRARKRSKRFAEQTSTERHRLRIAVKKLRYIIEILESLFDEIQVRKFVNRLKSLQDFLGHANDVRVAYGLLDELLEKTDHDVRPIDRGGGSLVGMSGALLIMNRSLENIFVGSNT